MVASATGLLYFFSLFPVAGFLLQSLQTQHKRYQKRGAPVSYVVTLGGWHKSNHRIPLTSQLSIDTLMRISEAIIIYRQNPGSKIIVSGNAPGHDIMTNAHIMALFAKELGVPEIDIIIEARPSNTMEEASYLKEKLQDSPFVLVTSASHMSRAISLFKQQKLHPQAAPVNYLLLQEIPFSLTPNPIALQNSDKAIHEYIGKLWIWIKHSVVPAKKISTTPN